MPRCCLHCCSGSGRRDCRSRYVGPRLHRCWRRGRIQSNLNPGDTRARRRLNASTLEALQKAFDKGGQRAIDKVMREQPAIFLKMLVLLVPREMQIEHSGSIKEMTDQQIDDAIAALKGMMDRQMIDVTPTTSSGETPESG